MNFVQKLTRKFYSVFTFKGLFASDIAIDFGTANTLVYQENQGIVLDEPSVVARIKEKGSYVPYAFGKKAKMMLILKVRKKCLLLLTRL